MHDTSWLCLLLLIPFFGGRGVVGQGEVLALTASHFRCQADFALQMPDESGPLSWARLAEKEN